MDQYIIIPSCSDFNRGDQALIWQTIKFAKNAGFDGDYYMICSGEEPFSQSEKEGIRVLKQILLHPSRKFKSKQNIKYGAVLTFQWGVVAFFDFLKSLLVLNKYTRKLSKVFLNESQKKTLAKFEESKAFFVKGGGFLHSVGKITDIYKIYYHVFHIILAESLNKPVYIMPNSYGPFNGLGVASLVCRVLKKCQLITTRESVSKEMLSKIGVRSEIFPDLGFYLKKSCRENIEIEKLRLLYPAHKLVAITVRPYRFPESPNPGERYENYIENMIVFAKWLYDMGFLPVFIEHTLSYTMHENDGSCIAEIVKKLADNKYALIANQDYDCRDLKAIYSDFDYVVGTRFHSVIFALSENVPSIAITYGGNKGLGIMRDLGLEEYTIPMDKFDFSTAKGVFLKMVKNSVKIHKQLLKNKVALDSNYCLLINRLKEGGK